MRNHMQSAAAVAAIILLAACSSAASASPPTSSETGSKTVLPVVALPGYSISVFTAPNSAESATPPIGPDSIALDQNHVFIDYQNKTAKDCTDAKTASSTVSEYSMDGKFVHSWNVPGHSDGMRIDPSTHLIWTTSCEDGNPMFATFDPSAGTVTSFAVPTPPHGGGYDDLYFLGGKTYIAASNPSLDSSGNNPFPAVDQIALA